MGRLVTREMTTAMISTMAERMKAQVRVPVMSLMVPASRVMKKLGIESIAGLVRYAMAEGLTSAELTPVEVL